MGEIWGTVFAIEFVYLVSVAARFYQRANSSNASLVSPRERLHVCPRLMLTCRSAVRNFKQTIPSMFASSLQSPKNCFPPTSCTCLPSANFVRTRYLVLCYFRLTVKVLFFLFFFFFFIKAESLSAQHCVIVFFLRFTFLRPEIKSCRSTAKTSFFSVNLGYLIRGRRVANQLE